MRIKRFFCFTAVLAMFFSLSGCATGPRITTLTGVWNDDQRPAVYLDKLMIVGIGKDDANRVKYEKHMAKALERRKIEVVTSKSLIPDIGELNIDSIKRAALASGVKAVLGSKVVGIDEEKVIFHQTQQDNYIVTPQGTYMRTYVFADPKIETVKKVRLETGLFDVESEKLIWAATSSIMGPDSVNEAIDDFTRAIMQQLTEDGYVRPGLLP